MTPLLSIVVPVFNEEKNISEYIRRILPIIVSVTSRFEIIFVLDPSSDRSEEIIENLHDTEKRIKLLRLSRRFGQPMATLAGLHCASGKAVIVMDVDLQDPPELIPEMVSKWKNGFDVVYAQRKNREGETLIKRMVSYLGYKFINRISEVPIPPNTGDFRLLSKRVVEEIKEMKESHGFLRGMVAVVGFKQTSILFDRPARFAGKGNYSRLFGSIRIGMNGVVGYSNYLLTLSTTMGFSIAGISFILGFAYFIMKLLGFPFPLGNPTIVILILFTGGIQLISVGILGAYIGRIYEEVKQRPKFIIDKSIGFNNESPEQKKRKH